MRLRRWMDEAHADGKSDAMQYRPPRPSRPSHHDGRFWRMAYDSGYAEGKAERGRIEREQYLAMRRQVVGVEVDTEETK